MPTILELFKSNNDLQVEKDRDTAIEQELTGIRVRSAVELNNPLIYGSDSIRILNKTTPSLDAMLRNSTGGRSDGLIGGVINRTRDKINNFLGIPYNPIPSKIIDTIDRKYSSTPITKDLFDGFGGTELGKILKESGGNPKTIGKQVIGGAVSKLKQKGRDFLFGSTEIGTNNPDANFFRRRFEQYGLLEQPPLPIRFDPYTNKNRYEDIISSPRFISLGGQTFDKSKQGLLLEDVEDASPIYGIINGKLKRPDGRFGKRYQKSSFIDKNGTGNALAYTIQNKYGVDKQTNDSVPWNLSKNIDKINETGIINANDKKPDDFNDLVEFYIKTKNLKQNKKIYFRSYITGLTDTFTPSWQSQKFFGNPYNFYTYDGIERSVSFKLNVIAFSITELVGNWDKLEKLATQVYPTMHDKYVTPPIIEFTIGNLYIDRTGYIESLTYTFPENGTWETTADGIIVPKFIDVDITIKLIQNANDELTHFNIKRTVEAQKEINDNIEKRELAILEERKSFFKGIGSITPKLKNINIITDLSKGTKLTGLGVPVGIPKDGKINKLPTKIGGSDSYNLPSGDSPNNNVFEYSKVATDYEKRILSKGITPDVAAVIVGQPGLVESSVRRLNETDVYFETEIRGIRDPYVTYTDSSGTGVIPYSSWILNFNKGKL